MECSFYSKCLKYFLEPNDVELTDKLKALKLKFEQSTNSASEKPDRKSANQQFYESQCRGDMVY